MRSKKGTIAQINLEVDQPKNVQQGQAKLMTQGGMPRKVDFGTQTYPIIRSRTSLAWKKSIESEDC
jgi:hypothetical protein